MKKTINIAIFAAFLSAPLYAGPNHGNGGNPCGGNCGNGGGTFSEGGTFNGSAVSHSSGGSFAASGGAAFGDANGSSFIRNEQQAGQLSGAHASFEGGDLSGTLITETFTSGFSDSSTLTRNIGDRTIGVGVGFSANFGEADAFGGFETNW